MESLAWNKISFTNPDLDPTPFVRELADKSILFTNFFSPTSATARAVFATVTNIPDVTSFKTSSRNPLVVDQHVIVNALKDALSKGKKSLNSVDKILLSYQVRDDVTKEGISPINKDWNKNLEETIRIAKTPWLDDDK